MLVIRYAYEFSRLFIERVFSICEVKGIFAEGGKLIFIYILPLFNYFEKSLNNISTGK